MRTSLLTIAFLSTFTALACSVESTSTGEPTSGAPASTTPPSPSTPGTQPPAPKPPASEAPVETEWTKAVVPASARVTDVSSSGASDAWAIGSDRTTSNKGVVLRFDGSSWTEVTMPKPLSKIDAIYTGGKDAVYVVSSYAGAVHRFDGTSWKTYDSFGVTNAYSIFGIAKDQVWLGTQWNFYTTPLHRFDGSSWTDEPLEGRSGVFSIWASSPQDVWAVRDELEHFDGSSWSTASPSGGDVTAIGGSGKKDAWAVGKDGFIAHWDGAAWTTASSGTLEDLVTVWASGPNDAWAGGPKALLHWDGKAWTAAKTNGAPAGAEHIRGTGQADAWATFGGELYRLAAKKK